MVGCSLLLGRKIPGKDGRRNEVERAMARHEIPSHLSQYQQKGSVTTSTSARLYTTVRHLHPL